MFSQGYLQLENDPSAVLCRAFCRGGNSIVLGHDPYALGIIAEDALTPWQGTSIQGLFPFLSRTEILVSRFSMPRLLRSLLIDVIWTNP